MNEPQTYQYNECLDASVKYFDGDELAASTFLNKYALCNSNDELIEDAPEAMHRRMAKEFARIEKKKFKNPLTEDQIFAYFDHFKKIVPQGSLMAGIGNKYQIVSLSNCVHGESLIYTKEHGLIKMRDVQAGMHVLTHKERFKKVKKHWSNGKKPLYGVVRSFSSKRSLIRDIPELSRFLGITGNHSVLMEDNTWQTVDAIKDKQYANKRLKQPSISYNDDIPEIFPLDCGKHIIVDEDFMYVCGMYLAEGAIKKSDTKHPSVYFTLNSNETDVAKRISDFSEKYLGHKAWIQEWDDYNFIQVNIFEPSFAILVDALFGHGFKNKRLPEWIFGLDKKLIESLLDGFMVGDGVNYESLNDDYNNFLLANPTLVYEIGMLFRKINKSVRFNFLCKGKLIKNRSVRASISTKQCNVQFVDTGIKDEVFDMEIEDDHSFVAGDVICHNCYVVPPPLDSYGGIMMTDEFIVQISKRRGGVGTDLSNLRPDGSATTNAARSSTGIQSFQGRYSNSVREVGQNGRRGALMLSLLVHHPEVLKFAKSKHDKDKRTGANISIRLTDEFLSAVEKDKDVELRWPVDSKEPKVSRMVNARSIWRQIVEEAHWAAEPGVLFWDNIIRESPSDCYADLGYRTVATNPSLRKDTLVLTENGAIAIKELSNIKGLTPKVMNIHGEWCNCRAFESGKNKQLYKITFTNNHSVYCTKEHKWPILNTSGNIINPQSGKIKKKRTDQIVRQDKIYLPTINKPINNESCKFTREDGFVIGWNHGDGWKTFHTAQNSEQYGFIFNTEDQSCGIADRVLSYTNILAKTPSTLKADHGLQTAVSYCTTDKNVINKFANMGMCKKSSGIPQSVWLGNHEFICGYIDGLFSADGSIDIHDRLSNCRIILVSSHEKLVMDMRKLLMFFGIKTNLKKSQSTSKFPNGKLYDKIYTRYDLSINGIDSQKFATIFKLSNHNKENKLEIIRNKNSKKCSKNGKTQYNNAREYSVVKSVESTDLYEDVYDISVFDESHTFMTEAGITGNCAELPLPAYDSCRLLVLNLFGYVKNPFTKEAYFDYDEFYADAQIAQRLMDDVIDLELECVQKIINKIKNDPEPEETKARELLLWKKIKEVCSTTRRTGTGITALGDTLAAIGLGYDTDEGIKATEKIYRTLKLGCYRSSVDMAKELGPFKIWNAELEKKNPFLLRIKKEDSQLYADMQKYGRRNIALLTTAPTGTVSIETQTTSGIEPLYKINYNRRKKVNPSDKNVRVDFVDATGDSWQDFPVYHNKVSLWMEITGETDITKSPWHGHCAHNIDWEKRIEVQSVATKHIDHSISSCLHPKTLIETDSGMFYIDELVDFSKIPEKTFIKNNGSYKVLNHNGDIVNLDEFYNNGESAIIKLVLSNGLELKCTANEKVLIFNEDTGLDEWKEISEIKEGDRVKIKNYRP